MENLGSLVNNYFLPKLLVTYGSGEPLAPSGSLSSKASRTLNGGEGVGAALWGTCNGQWQVC